MGKGFKIEHMALNVADPVAMAAWYEEHLGFSVVRHIEGPAQTHFLADNSGSMLIEIYNNPPEQVPNYDRMDPLQLHLAVVSNDPAGDAERLVAARATRVDELRMEDGSHLVMLRDPWGLALQLCKRARPMLRPA